LRGSKPPDPPSNTALDGMRRMAKERRDSKGVGWKEGRGKGRKGYLTGYAPSLLE